MKERINFLVLGIALIIIGVLLVVFVMLPYVVGNAGY